MLCCSYIGWVGYIGVEVGGSVRRWSSEVTQVLLLPSR